MAALESHVPNWEASGCAIRSFFVCFSYDSRAAENTIWKGVEAAPVESVSDIVDSSYGVDAPRTVRVRMRKVGRGQVCIASTRMTMSAKVERRDVSRSGGRASAQDRIRCQIDLNL